MGQTQCLRSVPWQKTAASRSLGVLFLMSTDIQAAECLFVGASTFIAHLGFPALMLFVYVCLVRSVCRCIHACLWRPSPSHPGTGPLTKPTAHRFWLGWLTLELQGRPLSVTAEDTGSYNHFQLFTWVPGIRTQVLTFV